MSIVGATRAMPSDRRHMEVAARYHGEKPSCGGMSGVNIMYVVYRGGRALSCGCVHGDGTRTLFSFFFFLLLFAGMTIAPSSHLAPSRPSLRKPVAHPPACHYIVVCSVRWNGGRVLLQRHSSFFPFRLHCVLLPEGCPWPIGRARAGAFLVTETRVLCCGKRLLKHICHAGDVVTVPSPTERIQSTARRQDQPRAGQGKVDEGGRGVMGGCERCGINIASRSRQIMGGKTKGWV